MLHFAYTFSEQSRTHGTTHKTVRIYRIKRNRLYHVCTESDTFVNEFQLFMEAAEKHKLLPKKAFERNPLNNCMIYGSAWSLEQQGIADVQRIV